MTKWILIVLVLCLFGCDNTIEWDCETYAEGRIVEIEIKGVGGWGSPRSVRVWRLEDNSVIEMSGWQNEHFKVGDYIIVSQCKGSGYRKRKIERIEQ